MTRPELRALARIARRDARHSPGRSALVTALVALPVAGLVVGLVLVRTTTPTADDVARWQLGGADLVVENVPTGIDLAAQLPPWARAVAVDTVVARVVLPGERLAASLQAFPLGDSLTDGMLQLDRGRAPAGPDEVAASAGVLRAAGVGIGDTLALSQPDVVLRVTGTVIEAQNIRGATLVVPPGTLEGLLDDGVAGADPTGRRRWLVAVDGDPADLASRLRDELGPVASATTRTEWTAQPVDEGPVSFVFVLGALALFEAALMASAAFAVGARRQTRSLGLVAATGGEQRHLAGVVLMGGVVLGAVGAGVGVVIGLAASLALAPSLDRITGTLIEGLEVPPLKVAGAGVLGVLAATAAAWLPARAVARIPAAVALAGRRPLTRPRRLASFLGLVAVSGGCGLAALGAGQAQPLLIVAGAITVVAGFAAWSPTLVGMLGRLAPRLPTSLRLAVRDAARHRTRVGPAAAAVMAALSMPVAVATYTATTDAQARAQYVPLMAGDQLLLRADGFRPDRAAEPGDADADPLRQTSEAVIAAVPGTVAAPVAGAAIADGPGRPDAAPEGSVVTASVILERPGRPSGPEFVPLTLGSPDLARAAGVSGEDAMAAFKAGQIVVLGQGATRSGMVDLSVSYEMAPCESVPVPLCGTGGGQMSDSSAPRPLPAVEVDLPPTLSAPRFILSLDHAASLGLRPLPAEQWLLRTPGPIDDAMLAQIRQIALEHDVFVQTDEGFNAGNALLSALALALSAIIALSVVAIATALSAAESRNDLVTLTAVGAGPQVRRRFRATQAGVLAVLGGVLAVPAGLLPAITVLVARGTTGHLVLPWAAMAAAALAVPLIAALAAGLSSRTPRAGLTRRLA